MLNTEIGLRKPRGNDVPEISSFLLEIEGSYEPAVQKKSTFTPNLHVHLGAAITD